LFLLLSTTFLELMGNRAHLKWLCAPKLPKSTSCSFSALEHEAFCKGDLPMPVNPSRSFPSLENTSVLFRVMLKHKRRNNAEVSARITILLHMIAH
jgi:hypothetical protein